VMARRGSGDNVTSCSTSNPYNAMSLKYLQGAAGLSPVSEGFVEGLWLSSVSHIASRQSVACVGSLYQSGVGARQRHD
jgi:hypothetical protein